MFGRDSVGPDKIPNNDLQLVLLLSPGLPVANIKGESHDCNIILQICICVKRKTPSLLLVDTLLQMVIKYFASVSVKIPRYFWQASVARSKAKSVTFHVRELAGPYSSPALKVRYYFGIIWN